MGVPGGMSVSLVQKACQSPFWYRAWCPPCSCGQPWGKGIILQLCAPRIPILAFMTGSLPRCEGRRGRAGVQLWPQGGAESPASQQYNPGWAQLFLETGRRGWGLQTSWGLLEPTHTLCPY